MRYIQDFRNGRIARGIASQLKAINDTQRHYYLMEFCGGHTHAIHRYGVPDLLPDNVTMVHGPGCPVCVLPIQRIDHAIALAEKPGVIFCSYGDMLRVPGTNQDSLLKAKGRGAHIRMVYSIDDALQLARDNPGKDVIFFAIGFETTTPPTAVALTSARQQKLTNFSVFCNHVMTPIAMEGLLSQGDSNVNIDGFVGPAHVSIIIGMQGYKRISEQYGRPIVISGFEPLDVLYSIYLLMAMINNGQSGIQNQYTRAVTPEGSPSAQRVIQQTMEVRPSFEWRGLGRIPHSAMQIRPEYADFDAERRFALDVPQGQEHKACECGAILRGVKTPLDCQLFAKACTPDNPLGSCMVSSEGACAAYYAYQRH